MGGTIAPLLRMRGLRIEGRAGGSWRGIVNGVDLDVHRGEVLGLIGESGAGKSTIGLAALAYIRSGCRLAGGSVTFDGIDLFQASEKLRRTVRGSRITYVAQSAAASFNPAHLLIEQTIEATVSHGILGRSAARADAADIYARLKLPDPLAIGRRYPHQVSGGQLQRAMTAMAMLSRPDLIVFDEPTTGLDVTTQVDVLAAIRGIVHQFNTAAIYITHDLAVVAQMADRIVILRHGRVVEEAPTKRMLDHPREEYTKTLWAVRNFPVAERTPSETLLAVKNVSASYGPLTVLDGVTIDVPRGRTTAIVGESGSGKSTLARLIAGLVPPTRGQVVFDGTPLHPALPRRDKDNCRRIQMIHQSADASLNPRQTVREIIGRPLEFFRGLRGAALDRRIGEFLEQTELPASLIDRFPGELSGGQKQRICIARALAAEPALIICDEITSALDQIIQEGILKLLRRVQAETNASYLFISHDIAAVRAIADEIVVMHRGRVVQQGKKADVLNPPHPPYTELLLSSVPDMDPDWLTRLLETRTAGAIIRP